MTSLFSARRKPKRIQSTEPHEDASRHEDDDTESGPVVRRPHAGAKPKSKLRISFDPAAEGTPDEQSASDAAPSKLSRRGASAISRSAAIRRDEESRPSYSQSHLDELKGSTSSTPKDLSLAPSVPDPDQDLPSQTQQLDIASNFGPPPPSLGSHIPSSAEVAEKKARRLRLAREHEASGLTSTSIRNNDDFVSLDAYDSDGEFKPSRLQLSAYSAADREATAQEHTRLVPDDEDLAEGYDQFVNDDHAQQQRTGRIMMGMHRNEVQERAKMRELIDAAEGRSGSEDSGDGDGDSDASAEQSYVHAQTSHGTAFSRLSRSDRRKLERDATRPKQPEKTTPIPTIAAGVARLRELKLHAEMNSARAQRRKDEIVARLHEIEGEKARIQEALEELGRQLEETERNAQEQHDRRQNGEEAKRTGGLDDIGERR